MQNELHRVLYLQSCLFLFEIFEILQYAFLCMLILISLFEIFNRKLIVYREKKFPAQHVVAG